MNKRKHKRFIKRLETLFRCNSKSFKGRSKNLSENGLFIKTRNSFIPNTTLNIQLTMPNGEKSFLIGKVKHAIKNPVLRNESGMGIKLIEKDQIYIDFINSYSGQKQSFAGSHDHPECHIITCSDCNVKNKVPAVKLSLQPKCGRCGNQLTVP